MEAFFSALKRRQPKEIAAEALELLGHLEAATELRETSRLTDAAIERTIKLTQETTEPVEPLDEQADLGDVVGPCDLTYADDSVVDHSFEEIRELIAKGKGKKALKLIKAAKEAGARGSVIKDLKKQAKEL